MENFRKLAGVSFFLILLLAVLIWDKAEAADKENCLMCHKYRQLGRIDEDGKKRSYFVNENSYFNSVHRNVPCRDCHSYIDKLPHDPVKEDVNCANECHIKPPFATEKFSHSKIAKQYDESVHGAKPEDSPDLKTAKPNCKYCHINPLFRKVDAETIDFEKTLGRCLNCHEEDGVLKAYMHITHRLRHKTSRSPQEIVQLCSKNCHEDKDLMKKFNVSKESLVAVETYKHSIHGKAVALGFEDAADCISCHATNAIHDIYKKDNIKASINEANRVETCKQCHRKVNKKFIQIDVHSHIGPKEKPVLYVINTVLLFVFYATVLQLVGLMLLETLRRKRDGIKWQLRLGTTWRGKEKRKPQKDK